MTVMITTIYVPERAWCLGPLINNIIFHAHLGLLCFSCASYSVFTGTVLNAYYMRFNKN